MTLEYVEVITIYCKPILTDLYVYGRTMVFFAKNINCFAIYSFSGKKIYKYENKIGR